MKTEAHFKLTYTKLDGTRAEKTYPSLDRLESALLRSKALPAHAGHIYGEEITPVEVAVEDRAPYVPEPYAPAWNVQTWDDDCQTWETAFDCEPCESRLEAEEEARHIRSQCAYKVRTRVIFE